MVFFLIYSGSLNKDYCVISPPHSNIDSSNSYFFQVRGITLSRGGGNLIYHNLKVVIKSDDFQLL